MDNHAECSKPKKSKSCSEDTFYNSQWAHLPAVVLHQIFYLLNQEDRRNASSVCRHWRNNLYHPKWWPSLKFKIEYGNMQKAKFYSSTFGQIVSEATISFNSLSKACIYEFILLLRVLNRNNHLKSLMLEPTHCQIKILSQKLINKGVRSIIHVILNLIIAILPRLNKFSIGCVEDLAHYTDCILKCLNPKKIDTLGLASVKDDPMMYTTSYFNPDLLTAFKQLQILSIDYDHLSDTILHNLNEAENLERLVIHLHNVAKEHPGTTNAAWKKFKISHPKCFLRLSVIHAYNAIENLHNEVLKKQMPLSHIKVFFCEDVNLDVLHRLSTWYRTTLRSAIWIDSLSDNQYSWKVSQVTESPDPFVLIAWLCTYLEELVLYGYKYSEDNLVAIGRLCGPKLKRLEVPKVDILFNQSMNEGELVEDVSKNLKRSWRPLSNYDLHPVIHDPVAGDSDEFLLPLVLQDLQ